ncbi:MAG TPA: class I SAM-dependent methyltransferase [Ktedonobacterales bacterium]|nr:class I SAM-dependent methyltransferase [Ktedonobacterales bacterium]
MALFDISRLFYWHAYLRGRPPWDTGISPPELMQVIEGEQALPAGKALDLGCGTGTNSIYLAQHGWDVSGVDFTARALERASEKAARSGVMVKFFRGDVTRLGDLPLRGPFDLLFDLGCFHSLSPQGRVAYAQDVASLSRPGTLLLLYAFVPHKFRGRTVGVSPDDIQAALRDAFVCEQIDWGNDAPGTGSAWYRFRRVGAQ